MLQFKLRLSKLHYYVIVNLSEWDGISNGGN